MQQIKSDSFKNLIGNMISSETLTFSKAKFKKNKKTPQNAENNETYQLLITSIMMGMKH